jgi:peptidylprolyl isomerase
MKKFLVIGLMLLVGLRLAACGSSESTNASSAKPASATTTKEKPAAAESPEVAHPGDWAALKRIAGPYSKHLLIPHGPAPKQVVIRNLKIGKGPVLRHGDNFLARYVDWTFNKALAVEPYWHSPSTYLFDWGGYKQGWEVGLRGIRVGGIRELIVPSQMAYKNGARVYIVQALKLR